MNGKRILAAVLAAAMTASSFTIDAFADNITPQNNVTDNSTENTVTAYTTNDEADDSVLAGSTVINCASLDELQSEHPYAENSDITYVYTDTSCNNLKITFSVDSSFEFIKDFLTIYDGDDNQIDKLGGTDLAGITVYVPGNTVKLRLTSDDSTCYYGFKVFSVENVDIMPTQGDPEYDYILKNISADDEAPVYYINKYKGAGGDIVIPSEIDGRKVSGISNGAFNGCTTATNVAVSDGISNIDFNAFSNCPALKSVSLPKGVTTINSGAFYDCKNLTDITLPDGLAIIETLTFYGCSSLADITIPDSVTEIGCQAFFNCTSLKTVTVPESVSTIDKYAFGYYYDSETNEQKKIDGFKINYTKNTAGHLYAFENGFTDESCLVSQLQDDGTVQITQYLGSDTSFAIPDEINGKKVTGIGKMAFQNCTSLTSITIPDSVTDIESYAFDGCTALTDIVLPDNVTSVGENAFYNCTSLKTATVPASVTSIGDYAFGYYNDGTGTKKIDGFKINYIKNTQGHIYAAINGFTDEACLFTELQDDGTVKISKYIGNDTVYVIPDEIDGKKVTSIGSDAFQKCTSLTSITIPDGVTDIEQYAFEGCTSLSDITLPDSLTSIGLSAFESCTALTDIALPDSLTYIDGFAFANCTSLKTVTVPASVTFIGGWAFGYYFEDGNIDARVAFDDFTINYTKHTAGHLYAIENGFTDEGCLEYTVNADGTLEIDKYVGSDTVFEIPAEIGGKKVTKIRYNAFENRTSLTSVTIPDSVTDIGFQAFHNCTSLKSVTIPASVISIGTYAFGYFYDANKETKIDGFTINYTKNTAGHLYAAQNGFTDEACLINELQDDGTVIITKYAGNDTVYEIPSEIDGKKVTGIGNRAFQNCTSLTSVTIPSGVTYIDECAFQGCSSLTDIALPDSLTIIGGFAFNNCAMLTSITIPNGVTRIEWETFYGCSALTDLVLPDTVTYIGRNAFFNCPSLKTVTIPASVTTIDERAFGYHYDDNYNITKTDGFKINYTKNTWGHYYAKQNGFSDEPCLVAELNEDGTTLKISKYDGNDTEYVIPEEIDGKKVTSIGNGAFNGNKLLTSVTIPDGVISIESFAFGSCTALTDVVLPDSITSIDGFAFDSCTSLSSVSIPAGVEYIGHRAFLNCTSLKSVTIPAGVKDIGEYAFGYYNGDNLDCLKTDGFRINYTKNTAGHYYAFKYGATDEACLVTKLKEDGTLKVTGYAGYDTEYVIPAEINGKKITEIGMTAFYECTSLTSVTIPDGVTSIGVEAFNRCTSLTDIVLPDSLTNIGDGAFANCTSLKSVTIPAGVTYIGSRAFGYYYDDNFVFTKVDGFKINYTKNTEGHYYATENGFSDETCLITYVVENSDTLAIEKYTGHDKTYVIPSEIDGKKITRIDSYAFKNRTSLTSVTIPDGVTIIGAEAFFGCTALTDINIPDGVTRIGSYAFNECSALADIKIPDSVTAIGMGAFNDTAILNNQDPTAKYVGKWLVYYDKTKTSASIKADTVGIADIAFYGCKIENIVIPDKVKYIGNNAFSSCSWLESVVIPDSVITIGEAAFLSCDSLASVSIPASVVSIEKMAFGFSKYNQKYDDFKIEYVKQTEGHRYAAENGFTDEIFFLTEKLDNGSLRVIGYAGKASSVTIPAEINGKSVTELGDEEYRFRYSGTLKSLTVPDSVIRINYKAFYDRNLTTVVLPEKLTDIGIGAFAVTPVIKKQKTDIKYIGSTVISCDTEAETLTIGDDVTTIASNAFVNGDDASNCGNLKSLIISRNVKYIGEHAFGYYLDEDNNYRKVEDFAIKCYCNSAAEQYAKDNGIEYELIADGHNAVVDKAVEPTCTKTGLTEGSHCSICGATLIAQKTIPATGHTEVTDKAVAATCTKTGLTEGKHCSVCNTVLKAQETIPATGKHDFGDWKTTKAATYTATGTKTKTCKVCKKTETATIAKLTLAKVSGFKVKTKDSASVTLQWNRNANASGYIIEVYNGKTWSQVTKIAKNSTLTYKVTKLSASKTYQYRIKAYKTGGKATAYSANSATLSVNTNPSNMSGFKAKAKSYNSITLQWNKNTSATGYELQKWDGKKWVSLTKIAKNSTTTYTVKSLKASTTYKYRIRAYKTIGKATQYSAYTATLSVNTNPSNMSGFKAKSKSYNSITLQWNKNTSATGYELQKWDGKKWVTLTKISKNSTTTYTVKSLKASTTYKYRIRAYKTIGKVTQYSANSATLSVNTNPSNMSGFKAKSKSYNSITLQWNKNTSATGYELQKWNGKKWTTLTKISKNSTTTYTIRSLKASTTYKYRIRAYKTIGKATQYSAYSATLSVNTNPTNMGGFKAKSKSYNSITLQWNKNASATGYELQKWDGKKWVTLTKISKNSTTTYTVKNLKAVTTYKFRIRAYKTIGKTTQYSAYTTTLSVNTNPTNMSGFKAKSTAKTSVTLQWNKNTSATGYEIQKWDGKKWVSAAKVTKNSTTTYTVKSLKASITYKFRIRAYKTIGKATQYSSWSGTLTVKTKK